MCGCHSILECCVAFSGVKLSIRSFVLFKCPDLWNQLKPLNTIFDGRMLPCIKNC